ncbi:MAG: hypothetical protein RQ745_14110 [Longimicrobiales bacterium]|nr:hypothetical protein [Longimicrobiales bacterium]
MRPEAEMRCTTCGEHLRDGEDRCPTCGAVVSHVDLTTGRGYASRSWAPAHMMCCARCGQGGRGVPYFSRKGHVALLVGVSVFTYGLGGLAYWLARRNHLICPGCGHSWSEAHVIDGRGASFPARRDEISSLPGAGVKRRLLGTAIVLAAALLILLGIVELEVGAVIVGSVMGAAGTGTFYWGWSSMQERRSALETALQRKVLHLATERRGILTVTEVAAALDLSLQAAEGVMDALDDGLRVRSEITDDGVIVYHFPEVQHRDRLGPGSASA